MDAHIPILELIGEFLRSIVVLFEVHLGDRNQILDVRIVIDFGELLGHLLFSSAVLLFLLEECRKDLGEVLGLGGVSNGRCECVYSNLHVWHARRRS
jgi:hypothetical protein